MKNQLAVAALLCANLIHAADFSALQREALLNYGANATFASAQLHNIERQLQAAQQNGTATQAPVSSTTLDRKVNQLRWWINQSAYEKNAHADKFKRNTALAGLDFNDVKTTVQTNTCEQAPLISEGIFQSTFHQPGTVWIQIDAPINRTRLVSTVGSEMDTQISAYDACPGNTDVPVATSDDDVGLYAQHATLPGARLTKRQWLAIRGDSAGRIQTRVALEGETVSGRVSRPTPSQDYLRVGLFYQIGTFFSYAGETYVDPQTSTYRLTFNAQAETDYYLLAGENFGSNRLLSRLYPNAGCMQIAWNSPLCDVANATKLRFSTGEQKTGVDFTLDNGASLDGRIIGTGPLNNARVSATVMSDGQPIFARDRYVDATGRYLVTGLMPNLRYALSAYAEAHQEAMYPNIECPLNAGCNLALTEAVLPGSYDIRLRRFKFLTVNTAPLAQDQVRITLYQENTTPKTFYFFGQRDFRIALRAGNNYVSVHANGYRPVLFGAPGCTLNLTGEPSCTNYTEGTAISGAEDQEISVALTPLPSVSGRILGGSGNMLVTACRTQNNFNCISVPVDTTGAYSLNRLAQGSYYIEASGDEIVDSLYPNVACQLAQNIRCSPELTTAQLVTVNATDVVNIDVSVIRAGEISGRLVQNSFNALELAKDGLTSGIYGSYYPGTGAYTIKDLVPGTYRARSPQNSQSFGQVYPGVNCTTTCGFNQSQPIQVISGQTTPNIDFSPASNAVIAGVVTDAHNNVIASMPVDILRYDSNNVLQREGAVVTDAQGRYSYFTQGFQNRGYVVATDARDYRNMIYQNAQCALGASMYLGTCAATNATTLTLPATFPRQFEQINFQLTKYTLFGNGFEGDRTK